jgi:hypothetical protein
MKTLVQCCKLSCNHTWEVERSFEGDCPKCGCVVWSDLTPLPIPEHPHKCDCSEFHQCGLDYHFWTCCGLWDCECDAGFIHNKDKNTECTVCGREEEDMPNSHCHEAIFAGLCPKGHTTYTGPVYKETKNEY